MEAPSLLDVSLNEQWPKVSFKLTGHVMRIQSLSMVKTDQHLLVVALI